MWYLQYKSHSDELLLLAKPTPGFTSGQILAPLSSSRPPGLWASSTLWGNGILGSFGHQASYSDEQEASFSSIWHSFKDARPPPSTSK